MTPDHVTAHVARRIARRRAELRMPLSYLSRHCGVSLQQIHRYEIGDNALSVAMLWRLARCLGAPIAYFFEDLDESGEPVMA